MNNKDWEPFRTHVCPECRLPSCEPGECMCGCRLIPFRESEKPITDAQWLEYLRTGNIVDAALLRDRDEAMREDRDDARRRGE